MTQKRKYVTFGVVFAFALIADQATKIWARASLKGQPPVVVIQDYFDFRYSENPGVAFGLLRELPYGHLLLPVLGIIALYVIFSFVRRARPERLRLAAELGLLAGGAVGNIADRLIFRRVTDFVVWKAPLEGWLCGAIGKVMSLVSRELHYCEWPTFNVADAALVVGVIALLLDTRADDMEPRGARRK